MPWQTVRQLEKEIASATFEEIKYMTVT